MKIFKPAYSSPDKLGVMEHKMVIKAHVIAAIAVDTNIFEMGTYQDNFGIDRR